MLVFTALTLVYLGILDIYASKLNSLVIILKILIINPRMRLLLFVHRHFHFDLIRGKISNINSLKDTNKTISIGIIDGRNIWKSDVLGQDSNKQDLLCELALHLEHPRHKAKLIRFSCSLHEIAINEDALLHVPGSWICSYRILESICHYLSYASNLCLSLCAFINLYWRSAIYN